METRPGTDLSEPTGQSEEPVYELADRVSLQQNQDGFFLLRQTPLSLLRINSVAFELLGRCDGKTTLSAAAVGIGQEEARDLLAHLATQGFLRARLSPHSTILPSISVVVPVRNRPQQIKECLDSLLWLDYPKDQLEIIVVDDGSDDSTPDVLASFAVRAILNPTNKGAATCRNLGWRAARGELIAFTDSDCRVDLDWLKSLVGELSRKDVAAVGGLVTSPDTGGKLDAYESCRSPLYSGKTEKEVKADSTISYLPTCNLIVKRSVLEELGGFDTAFPLAVGEDVDLVWRTLGAGYRVLYVPRGGVTHHHRNTLLQFAHRRSEYAASEAKLLRKHAHRRRVMTVSAPSLLFLSSLLAGFVSGSPYAYAITILLFTLHAAGMRHRLGATFASVGWKGVVLAIGRGHLGFVQYFLWSISQYYVLPLSIVSAALIGVFWLPAVITLSGLLTLLLMTAALSYATDRPKLGFASFAAIFCLDKLSFQVGTILGCLRQRTLRPLLPALKIVW